MGLTVIAIAGTVAAAASAYSAASAPGMPQAPNTAQAAWDAQLAQLEALPAQRALAAASAQGGKTSFWVPTHQEKRQVVSVPTYPGSKLHKYVPYVAAEWEAGGQYAKLGKPKISTQKVKVPGHEETADFTGYGAADVQGTVARQYADVGQTLSEKYGTQFAEEAAREARLADPEGYTARQTMYDQIQQELERTPERPVADLLDKQVSDQLNAGARLDPMAQDVLRAAVADAQSARNQSGTTDAEFAAPMETGLAGERRKQAGISTANRWLASGATPEDAEYRRQQQNMANLSAFISGQSPVAQFPQLSAAQQGTTPVVNGPAQPQMAGANVQAANQFALGNWNTAMQQAINTPNSWMTGISAALKASSAIAPVAGA